jgi:DNA-directed RNA polymerase subunit L
MAMEINLISKKDKTAVIELTDVKETFIYPLVDRLLDDKDVHLAAYKTGHPQLDRPTLTVKTERVNPETAVKKAADNLAEEVATLKKEFEKALRKPAKRKAVEKKARAKKKKELPKTKKTSAATKKKKASKGKKTAKKSGKSKK